MQCQRGQATIEWAGVVLVVSLALGALVALIPRVDGRSLGALLAHSIACAARGTCADGDAALRAAYGRRDADLVRRHAPGLVYERGTLGLPVDFRRCRQARCSDAADDRADLHHSTGGAHATAFSRVVHRGAETFIQYWLYYPDSSTTSPGPLSMRGLDNGVLPVYHEDDWESYQVRLSGDGRVWARASSHRGYQGCKERRCRDRWMPASGWTRISRGSHAGHLPMEAEGGRPLYPGPDLRERTSSAAGLALVPLESVDQRSYRPQHSGIAPPWVRRVYTDSLSDAT